MPAYAPANISEAETAEYVALLRYVWDQGRDLALGHAVRFLNCNARSAVNRSGSAFVVARHPRSPGKARGCIPFASCKHSGPANSGRLDIAAPNVRVSKTIPRLAVARAYSLNQPGRKILPKVSLGPSFFSTSRPNRLSGCVVDRTTDAIILQRPYNLIASNFLNDLAVNSSSVPSAKAVDNAPKQIC